MTGAAQEMIGKIGYSVRFQDGGKKEILSNQLTIAIFKSYIPTADSATTRPHQTRKRGRGEIIMVGTVVKANVVDM